MRDEKSEREDEEEDLGVEWREEYFQRESWVKKTVKIRVLPDLYHFWLYFFIVQTCNNFTQKSTYLSIKLHIL